MGISLLVIFGLLGSFCNGVIFDPTQKVKITLEGLANVNHLGSLDNLFDTNYCPTPFFRIHSECFYYNENELSWDDAERSCGELGGTLAEPTNVFHLVTVLRERVVPYNDSYPWVNGRDVKDKGWLWRSGRPVMNWQGGNPNKRDNEDCLMLSLLNIDPGPLYDYFCNEAYPSVCEYLL